MQTTPASSFYAGLLARLVYLPYWLSRLLLTLLEPFTFFRFCRTRRPSTVLCLEAGIRGWEIIEYKELLASAEEFVGADRVRKIEIDRNQPYYPQVRAAVRQYRPTHYVYDSRTGSERWLVGLIEAFRIAILFQCNGVVPICALTDLPIRAWRAQTAVVSARRGVVVSLMRSADVAPIYPHRRLVGPLLMAFSRRTLHMLEGIDARNQGKFTDKSLIFAGSLYEPRRSLLMAIQEGLALQDITLEIKGRELGSKRFTDEDYWQRLSGATLVITTANMFQQGGADWLRTLHLIYRYLEVPAVGSVLVAQEVPGLRRYLEPDVHYIAYQSPEEAIAKIEYYWARPDELQAIAEAGRKRVRALIEANSYWLCVDTALPDYPLV
jgi:hypothetical protein